MMFIANIVATGYSLSVEKERRVVLKASGVYRRSEIGDLLRSVACACLIVTRRGAQVAPALSKESCPNNSRF